MADNQDYRENIFGDVVSTDSEMERLSQMQKSTDVDKQLYDLANSISLYNSTANSYTSSQVIVEQANNFSVGDVVFVAAAGVYYQARAVSATQGEVIGMVVEANSASFTYATGGHIKFGRTIQDEGGVNIVPGAIYYISYSSRGRVSLFKPTIENTIIKPVFIATSETSGIFVNYRGTEIETLVLDEDDMVSDSAKKMATQQSIKAYTDTGVQEAKDYADTEIGDLDHGSLAGLTDDDHSQYSLASGTRAFTGVVSGVTPVADTDLATKLYVDTAAGSNAEDGTAAGQMLFWDGASEYKHTETAEIVWDDTNKRVGIGNAAPAVDLEVSHNYDGASAVYINNTTSGTNGAALVNAHGTSTSYCGVLGYFSAGHAVTAWQNKAALIAGVNTAGLNIVDQSSGNSIDFQVGGVAASDVIMSLSNSKLTINAEAALDASGSMGSDDASLATKKYVDDNGGGMGLLEIQVFT